jgi:hypothetical protein
VHQYPAEAFSEVLDPEKNNNELRRLLNEFQQAGNLRDFGKDNTNALTEELKNKGMRLALWVLGGQDGSGDRETQWAKYILTYKEHTGEYEIQTIYDYYRKLKSSDTQGNFGTVFRWTYANKQKGKSIQLKSRII